MSKLLKIHLIPLLLIYSINLFGQINDTFLHRGADNNSVSIDIATIKEATIKLNERLYLKNVVAEQDTIINNQKLIIDKYKEYNLYLATENINYKNSYEEVQELNNNLNKSIKVKDTWLYILGGTTVVSVTAIILCVVFSYGK